MRRVRMMIVLMIAMIVSGSIVAQDFSGAIKSLADLDSTIAVIKKQMEKQGKTPKMWASTDNNVKIDKDEMFYSLVNDLQIMSQELQVALGDAQEKAATQPKYPAGVGHGKLNFTGFLHQQYHRDLGDEEQSTFVSKRARLGVKGKLNNYAQLTFIGEFASSPKLLDAVITLSPTKNWSMQLGQYKPPYGAEFLTSGTMLPFVSTHKAKGLGTDRDIGASVSYKNKINKNVQMKFTIGVFNGSGINTSDANTDKNYIGRAEFKLAKSFTVAPNFIIGKTNEVGEAIEDINTYGGSVNWSWKNEQVQGEYHQSKVGETEKAGWYVWAGHSFNTNAKYLPKVQLLARYEQYDADINLAGNIQDRITIGTNLFIDSKYTKLQLNYQINGEETNSVDNDEFLFNLQVAF